MVSDHLPPVGSFRSACFFIIYCVVRLFCYSTLRLTTVIIIIFSAIVSQIIPNSNCPQTPKLGRVVLLLPNNVE